MKVLFLLDSLNRGGIEILTLDILRNAASNGLEILLVTSNGGDLEEEFRTTGCRIIFEKRKLPLDMQLAWALRKIIRENKITHVHTHQAVDSLHAYFATLGTNVKNIMSWHGNPIGRKNIFFLKFLSRRVDANIAVSREFRERIAQEIAIDTSNFHVVYNGVDPHKLEYVNPTLRREFGIAHDELLFGMVGNFYFEARDQFSVCKALPEFFQAIPKVKFVFVGNRSEENPHLFDRCVEFCRQNKISEKVFFLQQRSDIPNILHSIDAFVFSSYADTFGIALIEAMMCGLPCICSDIGPFREITDDGKYAALFKTANDKELAHTMIDFAQKSEVRKNFSESGKKWAIEKFSIDNHITNLKRVYKSVCAG